MTNTVIQIKRSSTTATPTNGSLTAAELAYSYNSGKLFIGDAAGTGVVEIGGSYWTNLAINAYNTANTGGSGSLSGLLQANAAFDKANSANLLAYNVSIGANSYADLVGAAANAYSSATYYSKSGGLISGDVSITGSLTVSGTTTYANTQTLLIGDNLITLNADLPGNISPTENAGIEVNRGNAQANAALLWNESSQKWQFTANVASGATYKDIADAADITSVATGANSYAALVGTSANAWASSVGVSANAYTSAVNTTIFATFSDAANLTSGTLNTARLSGSYTGITGVGTITTGVWNGSTINVAYGGTGVTTATLNGVLFGSGGSGALQVTSAGTEGQVLQASSTGVPQFAHLDGGSF